MLSPAEDLRAHDSTRLHLWWLCTWMLLVACASLYPFDFDFGRFGDAATLWKRLATWRAPVRRDLIVNLLAYLPVGLGAMLALRPGRSVRGRLFGAIGVGAALSLTVELLQHAVAVRVPSTVDWLLNIASTSAGALLALLAARMPGWSVTRRLRRLHVSPALGLLIVVWIASQAAPFVPRFRLSAIVASLETMLQLDLSVARLAASMAAFMVLSALLRTLLRRESFWSAFLLMALLSFAARLLFVGQQLTLDEPLALLLTLPIVARLRDRNYASAQTPLFVFIASAWLVQGLAPFELIGEPRPFHWLPFPEMSAALTDGGHVDVLRRALVCIGAVWVAAGSRIGLAWGTAAMLGVVALGEAAQRLLVGRVPDTTDALLVLFGALLVFAAERVDAVERAR